MFERDIYTIHSTYREDMRIKGFQFGKGEKSACIVGAARGNEIQQMYICSQLVKTLRELENNGCISAGKQILVIPTINAYSVNISRRFFGVKEADINRSFPGNDYGEPADRRPMRCLRRSGTTFMGSSLRPFTDRENSCPMCV